MLSRMRPSCLTIFQHIYQVVQRTQQILGDCPESLEASMSKETLTRVDQMVGQVLNIREVLGRQQIKVVFIGRTSSGKSTLINALLGERVLPTGLGHTTSCFVQVEGTSSNSPSLLVPLGEGGALVETQVESLPSLVSALGSAKLDEHSLAVLRWPSARCPLLEDDVVLVDSPGIDVSSGFDSWIDENCADADIFVLVANAESTLMMREKSFFKEVAERISKPNMVIVENRWDCTEEEEVLEGVGLVQEQHLRRCASFLVDELGVAGRAEVPHRVFFTSGKEALKQRLAGDKGIKDVEERHQQQQQSRLAEFRRLERLLADCLSSTLVATKYCSHTRTGRTICANVIKEFYCLLQAGAALEAAWVKAKKKLEEKLALSEAEMSEVASELRGEVEQMLTLVRQRVMAVMKQEVLALPVLIRDFPGKYQDDEVVLGVYVREMEKFLEHGLSVSVRGRIGRQVDSTVVDGQEQMVRRIAIQLPEERKAEFLETIPAKNPFETNFHVESLAHKDFRFIPHFQFSWGMISWAGACMPLLSQLLPKWPFFPPSPSSPALAPSAPASLMRTSRLPLQHAAFFSKVAIVALASQNSVIGTLASSVILRRLSLRLFGLVCLAHGALYLYERGRWQWWGGQERQVQQEFLRHLQAKLHLLVPQVASTVCQQIQGELHTTLATVCALVEGSQHCLYR